ncbi:MAG: ATP-grasp fold amidoligase family protein [Opitutaceae bacterium]
MPPLHKFSGRLESLLRPVLKKVLPPKSFEAVTFYLRLGYWPQLDAPRSFNEVISHRKLNEKVFPFPTLIDKLAVRDFVESRIGDSYFTNIIQSYTESEAIRLADLPEAFAFKCNAGSGMNQIVSSKQDVTEATLVDLARTWMSKPYSEVSHTYECIYDKTPRCVYAEELLDPLDSVREFKFWCIGGKPVFVQTLARGSEASGYEVFRPDGQIADYCVFNKAPKAPSDMPACLSKLLELAGILAEGFDFVRVDLMVSGDDRITFSEMTFHPGGGRVRFFPRGQDFDLGEQLPLFAKGPEDASIGS